MIQVLCDWWGTTSTWAEVENLGVKIIGGWCHASEEKLRTKWTERSTQYIIVRIKSRVIRILDGNRVVGFMGVCELCENDFVENILSYRGLFVSCNGRIYVSQKQTNSTREGESSYGWQGG